MEVLTRHIHTTLRLKGLKFLPLNSAYSVSYQFVAVGLGYLDGYIRGIFVH